MRRPKGYTDGDWLATCWRCGRARLASTMRKHWQGYYVCPEHWESRHPQDFVRGASDTQSVPWSQPPTDIDIGVCTLNGLSSIPGYSMVGCAIPGRETIDLASIPVVVPDACDIYSKQGVPGWGKPGCSLPGFDPLVS